MKHCKTKLDQKGIVSILVTLIMTIVITLLVLGLSNIAISEQKNSLKRQLSTEAYYLALSGINNAISYPNFSTYTTPSSPQCNGVLSVKIDTSISIPCVVVNNSNVTSVTYTVNSGVSKVFSIRASTTISQILLTWTGVASANITNTKCIAYKTTDATTRLNQFKPQSNWTCGAPVLMVDVLAAPKVLNYSDLLNGSSSTTSSVYLLPTFYSVSSVASRYPMSQKIIPGKCTTSTSCSATLYNLPGYTTGGRNTYYIRVTPIYTSSVITVNGQATISGKLTNLTLLDPQADIDSNAQVNGSIQRLGAKVSFHSGLSSFANQNNTDQLPVFGIQTTNSLCKRIAGYYNSPTDYVTQINLDGITGANPNTVGPCTPN